jgi:hypothetical protein
MIRIHHRVRRTVIAALVVPALLIVSALPAAAVVTRLVDQDADWFVGKGDIQSAFGWDAKTTDARIDSVTFTYAWERHYTYECQAVTGSGQTRTVHVQEDLSGTLETARATAYETRTSKRSTTTTITGVLVTLSGQPDVDGLTCPQIDGLTWSVHPGSRTLTGEDETLYAHSTQAGRKGTSTTVTAAIWSASTSD